MRMSLYVKGYSRKMFTRDSATSTTQGKAWWLTAFQPAPYMPGKKAVGPHKLKMTGTIWFDSNSYTNDMRELSEKFMTQANSKKSNGITVGGTSWKKRTFKWEW